MKKTTLLLASMALAVLLVSGAVWADTFTVKNEKDSGPGSLRAAITSANKEPGRDVITFAPSVRGTINLKSELPTLQGELEMRGPGASKLTVRRNVTALFRVFTAAKGSNVTVSGLTISNGKARSPGTYSYGGGVYNPAEGELTLRSVVVSANRADYGGGVYNEGGLIVRDSSVSGNDQDGIYHESGRLKVENSILSSNEGDGITNDGADASAMVVDGTFTGNGGSGLSNYDGTLTVLGSTIANHLDPYGGNGIANLYGGTLTVRDSTISGNNESGIFNYAQRDATRLTVVGSTFSGNGPAYSRGGGLNNNGGIASVQNSTFYDNTAPNGGAVANVRRGKLTLANSTIYGNRAANPPTRSHMEPAKGGGIYIDDSSTASFVLRETIVANNDAPQGPDAFGSFSSGGYNLIGDTSGASGFGATDLTNTRSGLDPRGPRDNGGPTKTIALVSGSPAIDAVPRAVCPPPATDQRGISRPQDGDDDGAARCDIGAYERRAPAR